MDILMPDIHALRRILHFAWANNMQRLTLVSIEKDAHFESSEHR